MEEKNIKNMQSGENIPQKNKKFMQQCDYCDNWFVPKRRFVQRYCCNSCRVMAYNRRNSGINHLSGSANSYNKNNCSPNTQEQQKEINQSLNKEDSIKETIKEINKTFNKEEFAKEVVSEIKPLLAAHERRIQNKLDTILSNLDWVMGFSIAGALLTDKAKNNFYNNIQNVLPGIAPQGNNSIKNTQGLGKPNKFKIDWSKIKGIGGKQANINNEKKPEKKPENNNPE